jgi:RNA polymerase sigma-70 factor (ECF subfamily)
VANEYANKSDNRLIKEVLRGDAQAYGELYQRYVEEIYRYIYFRSARNRTDAEDLTQMVFMRAWKTIMKNSTDHYHFRSLAYTIARNLTIDQWRAKKDEISLEDVEEERLSHPFTDPEQNALTSEQMDGLQKAIRRLDPIMQDVIICRFANQLSRAETAKTLGITEGHVRVLQHRALKEIRKQKDEKE